MRTFNEIKNDVAAGTEFYAVGKNGKKYEASFDRELKAMFFCIPASVEIIGYLTREN